MHCILRSHSNKVPFCVGHEYLLINLCLLTLNVIFVLINECLECF